MFNECELLTLFSLVCIFLSLYYLYDAYTLTEFEYETLWGTLWDTSYENHQYD